MAPASGDFCFQWSWGFLTPGSVGRGRGSERSAHALLRCSAPGAVCLGLLPAPEVLGCHPASPGSACPPRTSSSHHDPPVAARQLGASVCLSLLLPEPVRSSRLSGCVPAPTPPRGHRPWRGLECAQDWRARVGRARSGGCKGRPDPGALTGGLGSSTPEAQAECLGHRPINGSSGTLLLGSSDLALAPYPPCLPHTQLPSALG